MPVGLTIRSATAEDEAAVVRLWQVCGLVANYNDPYTDFRFARAKAASDILVGVADDGALIGTAMVGHEGHRGWVYYVATHPDYRKQGVGRRMMAAAEAWHKEHGIKKMLLLPS